MAAIVEDMSPPERPDDCLFCKIVTGEIHAKVVHATDTVMAFRDVNPQAPTHVLVVPTSHYATAAELAHYEPACAAELITVAAEIAGKEGLDDGYRLVLNTGEAAGQTVHHVHLHVLGGRHLSWPPG